MSDQKLPIIPLGCQLFNQNYVVDEFLAFGGMNSQIYKVHIIDKPDKIYAAKVIYKTNNFTEDFWNKINNEAITSLRLINKNNVIHTFEIFSYKDDKIDTKVFIMEYIDGFSLKKYLTINGPMMPKMALKLFLKILYGIKSLHDFRQKIIHRDLKPENIMITKDFTRVVILDFGISSIIQSTSQSLDEQKQILTENKLYGTIPYVIPDILDYKNPNYRVTVQFDFFSLGVILYEMIIGNMPFDTSTIKNKKNNKYQEEIIKLPRRFDILNISKDENIPIALENLIFRCLASKKDDLKYRYDNINDLIDETINCIRIIENGNDKSKLIKPTYKRLYQNVKKIDINVKKDMIPYYKKWWFFSLVLFSIFILILLVILLEIINF